MIEHLGISRRRLAFILGALAMFGPFSIDTIFPAFAVMERELGIGKAAMQQTISVYLLGYAAMSLVHGPLSDALGRRPVILWGVAVFALASVGCALSGSLPVLLAFHDREGREHGVDRERAQHRQRAEDEGQPATGDFQVRDHGVVSG